MTHVRFGGSSDVALLLVAVATSALAGALGGAPQAAVDAADVERVASVVDASGTAVPSRRYERIVSLSTVGDQLLHELVEPSRIAAIAGYGLDRSPIGHHLREHPVIDGTSIDRILAMEPGLVLAHSIFDSGRNIARLRELGLVVFDLGPMRGRQTFLRNAADVGRLLDETERAERLCSRFERRLDRLARDVDTRPRALYLAYHGTRLSGGAGGTSYRDVIEAAGLEDAAGDREGWPHYTPDEILALDPDWLVTSSSSADGLCMLPGLSDSRACLSGRVAAIEDVLLSDPGLLLPDAAEALFDRVHRVGP